MKMRFDEVASSAEIHTNHCLSLDYGPLKSLQNIIDKEAARPILPKIF